MWSQHRWIRAGFVIFVLGALGLTWAALGDYSRATDAAPPEPTCGCGQAGDITFTPHPVEGDVVEFVVTTNIATDILIRGLQGAVLVFTGPSQGTTDVGDCDADLLAPVQSAVVTGGGGEPALIIEEIMPTSQDEPVQPGTRVGNLTVHGQCNGTEFTKFRGTVQ